MVCFYIHCRPNDLHCINEFPAMNNGGIMCPYCHALMVYIKSTYLLSYIVYPEEEMRRFDINVVSIRYTRTQGSIDYW